MCTFFTVTGDITPDPAEFRAPLVDKCIGCLGLQTLFIATCEDCDVFVHKISFQTINHLPYQEALDSETAQHPSADASVTHTITDVQDCVYGTNARMASHNEFYSPLIEVTSPFYFPVGREWLICTGR
jgi:hypothetical protein